MKEWHKDFLVGLFIALVCCGVIILFYVRPDFLVGLVLLGLLFAFFWMCYVVGKNVRNSNWYDSLVWYIKRKKKRWENGIMP